MAGFTVNKVGDGCSYRLVFDKHSASITSINMDEFDVKRHVEVDDPDISHEPGPQLCPKCGERSLNVFALARWD